ncbi:MAG: hypothetical protein JZU65_17730 [Chlorobium sp.]|nr:hypothetical protein [Chlorobium sp.]
MLRHQELDVLGAATTGVIKIKEDEVHTVMAVGLGVGESIDVHIGTELRHSQLRIDGEDVKLTPDTMARQLNGPFNYILVRGSAAAGVAGAQ